jgi:hypothetical protein
MRGVSVTEQPDYLKAFELRNFSVAFLESFVLNKHTGLAIWTKI